MKLIVTRGLPACGKTTWAKAWVAEDTTGRVRVNRDDLRAMAHDGTFVGGRDGTERSIIATRDAAIRALLLKGLDVVCDDTNLPSRTVRDLRRIAVLAGAEFEVRDMTDVELDVCLKRDAARGGKVGEDVIRDLHKRYLAGRPHPLPVADDPADAAVEPYVPPEGAPTAVMVDIDGTVALMCDRYPFDWERVHQDRPNRPVLDAVRAMAAAGHRVVFMSARKDICREATEQWLIDHYGQPYEALHMRAAADDRKDSAVKTELFDEHVRHRYRVACVFDDRDQVVRMWRDLGLTVFQVADGAF